MGVQGKRRGRQPRAPTMKSEPETFPSEGHASDAEHGTQRVERARACGIARMDTWSLVD